MLFDQVAFEDERIDFIFGNHMIEIMHPYDQGGHFGLCSPVDFLKIKSYPMPLNLGLTDIDNSGSEIFHQINTGLFRQSISSFSLIWSLRAFILILDTQIVALYYMMAPDRLYDPTS